MSTIVSRGMESFAAAGADEQDAVGAARRADRLRPGLGVALHARV
jgi:hypothetical protein